MQETRTDNQLRANLWFTFAAASVLLAGICVRDLRILLYDAHKYHVFGSFWASGAASLQHLNPYAFYPLTWSFHPYLHDAGPLMYDINLSPPAMMPLLQLAAMFPIRNSIIVWTIVSFCLFFAGTWLIVATLQIQKRQVVWLLLSSCVTDTLWFGQDYSLMFFAACLIWYFIYTDKEISAAICIGILITMKPNLGLWPIMLFVAGYKRKAIISAITGASLSLIPVFLYGPSIYRLWLAGNSQVKHNIFTSDLSIIGVFTRLGLHSTGVVLSIVTGAALILYMRKKPDEIALSGIAVCSGILCAPLAWHHYALFAAPFFVARRWTKLQTFAAVLIATPSLLTSSEPGLIMFLVAIPHLAGLGILLWSFMAPSFAKSNSLAEQEELDISPCGYFAVKPIKGKR